MMGHAGWGGPTIGWPSAAGVLLAALMFTAYVHDPDAVLLLGLSSPPRSHRALPSPLPHPPTACQQANLARIAAHNARPDVTFQLGLNGHADLSVEEFRLRYFGAQ